MFPRLLRPLTILRITSQTTRILRITSQTTRILPIDNYFKMSTESAAKRVKTDTLRIGTHKSVFFPLHSSPTR